MKRKVYKSELGNYVEMEVVAQYKFLGESKGVETLTKGKVYDCVGYDDTKKMVRIVDDSGEDYLYVLDCFELIENVNEEILYYYILVKYEDCSGYKEYNYISDDSTVKEGDRVLVDRAGVLTVAEVLETGYFNKLDAPFPLEKTKRIIKKVDKDFELEDIMDYDQDDYCFDLEENFSSNCIKMNIDGTYFEFGISNYISGKENDENWANIKIKIYNYYFKYVTNSELMTCAETEYLLHELELLLNDKMDKPKRIGFYEPDIDFYLYPKMNLWDTGEYVYIKEGHEIQDIYMELNINLTDRGGAYIGQKYSITFNRKEIEKIADYIRTCIK